MQKSQRSHRPKSNSSYCPVVEQPCSKGILAETEGRLCGTRKRCLIRSSS
ncbi:hypothetical protein TTRE_0000000201 [Trichuris trichiura]|uniref:Uncharacterized protein n=1 Tax=Trichuris trichiura TaxID=36087 RepID=A0A077YWD9_TRITR|nr:hypothetical protein TTRE_0000000201 [Trichuris trichiura]